MANKVSDKHPDYVKHEGQWRRISDCLGGIDTVREAAQDHLPRLAGHVTNQSAYAAYVQRALFADMVSRVVDALVGAVYRRDPVVKVPSQFEPRLENIDGRGSNFTSFSKMVTRQVLSFGRGAILVDASAAGTVSQFDKLAKLPKLTFFPAVDIRNWRYEVVGGERRLAQVILAEDASVAVEFGSIQRERLLVLELVDGMYCARRFEANEGGEYEQVGDTIYPTDNLGRPLGAIPVVPLSHVDLSFDVVRSPVSGLAEVDLSWFRTSADLESGRYKLAFPVPVIIGADEANQTAWHIGGDAVWMLPMGADAKMLEFTGDGLGSLERALVEKERVAATLGARLLSAPSQSAETSETVRLKQSSETSVISSLARTVSDGLTRALEIAMAWAGVGGKVSCELNQDYMDSFIAAPELRELRETALAGLMPLDDFLLCMQRGEAIRPELSLEEIRGLIETQTLPNVGKAMDLTTDPANEDQPEPDNEANQKPPAKAAAE